MVPLSITRQPWQLVVKVVCKLAGLVRFAQAQQGMGETSKSAEVTVLEGILLVVSLSDAFAVRLVSEPFTSAPIEAFPSGEDEVVAVVPH